VVLSTNRFHHEYQAYTELRRSHWDKIHAKRYQDETSYYRKCLESIYGRLVTPGSKVLEFGCGNGRLLASLNPSYGLGIDFSELALSQARQAYPHLLFTDGDAHTHIKVEAPFDYIIVSDLVNDLWDIQGFLKTLKMYCSHETRVIFNFHSHLWNIPLSIARTLRLATPVLPQNWLTKHDLENFLKISGFESLSQWSEITIPINLGPLSRVYNRFFAKLWPFRHLNLANFIVARAVYPTSGNSRPSVSVVVAARNEAGHIDELIRRIPHLGREAEIIFIEGHSKDNTYEVIKAAKESHPEKNIKLLRRLPCQGYNLEVEVSGLQTLGLKIAGGNRPRDSWGRYSL
jgi:SAM-dependent methyltransferase